MISLQEGSAVTGAFLASLVEAVEAPRLLICSSPRRRTLAQKVIRPSRVWPRSRPAAIANVIEQALSWRAACKLSRLAPSSIMERPIIWPHLQIERLLSRQILCVRHERQRV